MAEDISVINDVLVSIQDEQDPITQVNVEESTEHISVATTDEVPLSEYYQQWSDEYKRQKVIAGKTLIEWYKFFEVDLSPLQVEDITMVDLGVATKLLAVASKNLAVAHSYYRSAIVKYNAAVINASVKFLTEYEEIMADSESPIRNLTKEKIKMVAEARGKGNVVVAMYAREEKEFFSSIIQSLRDTINSIKYIIHIRELAYREV